MTQFAEINRFCAIEGRYYEHQVAYQGTNSFFFAYPSDEYWQDFSKLLTTELEQQNIRGTRWQDVVRNDLLFSKACEGIYGHDYLLAEITEPNANVLLEVGYALAVGRLPILLKDRRRPEWDRALLTTFESCFYETREEIILYVVQTQSERRDLSESPNRTIPLLENMGIFDAEEDARTIYHLKPNISRDWISAIDRRLKDSPFVFGGTDPSDSSYDEFFPQARAIQSASRVVGSLLGTNTEHYQQHNANVALLIGFAIGLGKEVLVLQAEPRASVLDLGSLAQLFTTESQAVRIVNRWLDVQTRAVIQQRTELRRKATERGRVDQIRRIYLGHPDALQDTGLLDYFVPTTEYDDAIEGRRSMFIGRRGTGKSANFKAISEHLRARPSTVAVEIAPDDYELQRITEYLESHHQETNPVHLYRSAWNYVLITEMINALAEQTDSLFLAQNDQEVYNLRQYYQSNRDALDLDFGSRVTQALIGVLGPKEGTSEWTPHEATQTAINELRNYRITRHLKDFAAKQDTTFFLVADDLDKNWSPSNQQSVSLLMGLINEAAQLQIFFEGRLNVVAFLRQDIFEAMAQIDEDLPKRSYARMEWTNANLKHLVAARLARGTGEQDGSDDEIWSGVFPEDVDGVKASEYILSRALPRPRDVLSICQAAIDQAQKNGHAAVSARDIADAEAANAVNFIRSLESEFRGLYPNLAAILNVFARIERTVEWEEFSTLAELVIQEHEEVLSGWGATTQQTPRWFADVLFRIGLIGLSDSGNSRLLFRNGRSFEETWIACAPNPLVHIHPAFFAYLGTSP